MSRLSFRELASHSASRGGMERTLTFTYDENVTVVMAAFRERTRTPHSSMPLVHRVDILDEREERPDRHLDPDRGPRDADADAEPGSHWAMRLRRFFAANDAPEWVRKISGGEYLTGTERIEWSEREGRMVMYTVNESHARLVTAEEICVIAADPEAPETRTVKTLTVRARLRVRGWWTLGLSRVAERFLLGRYASLVEQGRRIELAEMAKWRADGRAARLLEGSAPMRREKKREANIDADASHSRSRSPRRPTSPTSTLRRGASEASAATVDGLKVETVEAFERSIETGADESFVSSVAGPCEDDWLMMRWDRDGDGDGDGGETSREEDAPRVESPLHVPLEDVEEDDESADEGAEDEGAEDEGAEDEGAKDEGADAKSRRFSFGDGDAPPSPIVDAFAETLRAADASERWSESKRRRRRNRAAAERAERDAIAKKLGLETEEARRARASLRWRRALVRAAMTCAAVALAKERRDDWAPVALAAKRTLVGRRARGSVASRRNETTREIREGKTSVEGGVAIEDETKEGAGDDASAERGEGAEDNRRE